MLHMKQTELRRTCRSLTRMEDLRGTSETYCFTLKIGFRGLGSSAALSELVGLFTLDIWLTFPVGTSDGHLGEDSADTPTEILSLSLSLQLSPLPPPQYLLISILSDIILICRPTPRRMSATSCVNKSISWHCAPFHFGIQCSHKTYSAFRL